MRIWIDADGCPVRKLVLRIAEEFAIEVIQVADRSHEFREGTAVLVDIGADSAEYHIISKARPGDLMITQDYGAAALALGKGLRSWIRTDGNIQKLTSMGSCLKELFLIKSGVLGAGLLI